MQLESAKVSVLYHIILSLYFCVALWAGKFLGHPRIGTADQIMYWIKNALVMGLENAINYETIG